MNITFFPLYIDPGTGSILFSVIIGITATVYFLFRTALVKAKIFFAGGKKTQGSSNQFVIYAEDKRYWSLFKSTLDEFEKRNRELLYLTCAADDPVFSAGYTWIKPQLLNKGNKAFAALNLLSADLLLSSTPGLDVYQWKRSKSVKHYAHVLHAVSDATQYRLFGIDYYDSVLLTGAYQAADIRKLEEHRGLKAKQLVTVGCPYLDEAEKNIAKIPKEESHQLTVLVSPSWGASALLSRYGTALLNPLTATGCHIIVRPHPQSTISESAMLKNLKETYRHCANLEWDYERDNIYALAKADIMISDFSGIIFDYMFLRDKPVLYVNYELDLRPYDAYCLPNTELWQIKTLHKTAVALHEADFEKIGSIIQETTDNAALREERQKALQTAWQFRGEAGKQIADFMIATVEAMHDAPPPDDAHLALKQVSSNVSRV